MSDVTIQGELNRLSLSPEFQSLSNYDESVVENLYFKNTGLFMRRITIISPDQAAVISEFTLSQKQSISFKIPDLAGSYLVKQDDGNDIVLVVKGIRKYVR